MSITNLTKSKHGKSCPECSRRAGRLIFKLYEDFGLRKVRGMTVLQSWCKACR